MLVAGLLALATTAAARIEHVIHISVDGLRGDTLRALVNEPASQYRTFRRLYIEGAVTYNARCDYSHSITIPNHTSMITGRPVLAEEPLPPEIQHGYLTNYTIESHLLHVNGFPTGYKASTFDRVHDRGRRTGLFLSKSKMSIFDRSYGPEHGAPDTDGEDNGRDKIDRTVIIEDNTPVVVASLISEMHGDFPAYTFLHLCDPDYAGHISGWTSFNWRLAVLKADTQLGLLLGALDLRPELKATTAIVLTADHGGGVPDWSHLDATAIENITIPVILWGPGLPRMTDAHTLFSNRFDPGARRVSNTDPRQPLRNGDTGNIAMALLGLPPVAGSFHRPEFHAPLEVILPAPNAAESLLTVRWPAYLHGWTLEASESLGETSWAEVTPSPVESQGFLIHTEASPPDGRRFFRLRPPE